MKISAISPYFGLDAYGVNQHQGAELVVGHGCHFGGDPASHGGPHEDVGVEAQKLHQFEVHVGHVGDGVHPVGALGAIEACLGWGVYGVGGCQGLVVGLPAGVASSPVQEQQREAGASAEHLHGDASDFDVAFVGCGDSHGASHCKGIEGCAQRGMLLRWGWYLLTMAPLDIGGMGASLRIQKW